LKAPAEQWLPVVGYEDSYEVSDHGRVRSIPRIVVCKNGAVKFISGRILKQSINQGHLYVSLWANNKGRNVSVHLLMATTFLPKSNPKYEVCHGDGNGLNNSLANLRWDSRRNNHLDSVKHGTHFNACKTHCKRGHLLIAPNLVASVLRQGRRNCLACSRGEANARDCGATANETEALVAKHYESIKAKSPIFLGHESALLDKEVVDIESEA